MLSHPNSQDSYPGRLKEEIIVMNPIEWFEKTFCVKCKTKTCQPKGGMVYSNDPLSKLACLLALNAMLNIDRGLVKGSKKG